MVKLEAHGPDTLFKDHLRLNWYAANHLNSGPWLVNVHFVLDLPRIVLSHFILSRDLKLLSVLIGRADALISIVLDTPQVFGEPLQNGMNVKILQLVLGCSVRFCHFVILVQVHFDCVIVTVDTLGEGLVCLIKFDLLLHRLFAEYFDAVVRFLADISIVLDDRGAPALAPRMPREFTHAHHYSRTVVTLALS